MNLNPLFAAEAEMDHLRKQRNEIDKKIETLQEAINILRRVYKKNRTPSEPHVGDSPTSGMTEQVVSILMNNPDQEFSPTEIRDLLVTSGFDLTGRSNPLAEIHQTLKRLVRKSYQIVVLYDHDGKALYKYDSTMEPAARIEQGSAQKSA